MREYKEVKRETVENGEVVHSITDRRLVKLTCCLCGETAPRPDGDDARWGKSRYDIEKVCVYARSGSNYPEGGSYEQRGFDVCPECFEEKLVPWFKAQGAEVETSDLDW